MTRWSIAGQPAWLVLAAAEATQAIPLRPNRVHPLTREDRNDNVGIHAPEVTYAVEPLADWIDVTAVHKGGLFGSDYRMLFPGDGIAGIKRFFVDTLIESGKRGLKLDLAVIAARPQDAQAGAVGVQQPHGAVVIEVRLVGREEDLIPLR